MANIPTSTIDAPASGDAAPAPAPAAGPRGPGRAPAVPADRLRRAFEQAVPFTAFVADVEHHADEFADALRHAALDDDDRALTGSVPGPVDVLAIVEDWCPDVVATLPVVHRIAEAGDRFRLHVLVRGPETSDVADAYPHEGRSHIPTYVVLDDAGRELGVLVERTPEIGEAVGGLLDTFLDEHPEVERATFPATLTGEARAELLRRSFRLRHELRDLERRTLVRDLVAIATTGSTTDAAVPAAAAPASPASHPTTRPTAA